MLDLKYLAKPYLMSKKVTTSCANACSVFICVSAGTQWSLLNYE